ncbi:MAG: hypothetical protein QW338_05900 [Conexivisphaerales archaeon]
MTEAVQGDKATLQPGHYAYVPINTENKHFLEYSKGKASELLLTDNFVCITFTISEMTLASWRRTSPR